MVCPGRALRLKWVLKPSYLLEDGSNVKKGRQRHGGRRESRIQEARAPTPLYDQVVMFILVFY